MDLHNRGIIRLVIDKNPDFAGTGWRGLTRGNRASVYWHAHDDIADIAKTAIHEAQHAAGIAGSQRAELVARIAEMQSVNQKVKYSWLKEQIKFIRANDVYNKMPNKIGAQSIYFREFIF